MIMTSIFECGCIHSIEEGSHEQVAVALCVLSAGQGSGRGVHTGRVTIECIPGGCAVAAQTCHWRVPD